VNTGVDVYASPRRNYPNASDRFAIVAAAVTMQVSSTLDI
jgi:hypothetical protein